MFSTWLHMCDKYIHNNLLIYSYSQADKSPVIAPAFLLLPLMSVSYFSHVSSFPPSLSTVQGQLENISCSFLAQTRHSPGPLIKHKLSLFQSLPFSPRSLSPCTVTFFHLLQIPSSTLSSSLQPLSINSLILSLYSRLSPGSSSLALFAYLSR